jgi:hypothetical protein
MIYKPPMRQGQFFPLPYQAFFRKPGTRLAVFQVMTAEKEEKEKSGREQIHAFTGQK